MWCNIRSTLVQTHFTLLSYGMYLMHMFALIPVFAWVKSWGIATPLVMLISAFITYVICAVVARLLAFLPKSKYIVG